VAPSVRGEQLSGTTDAAFEYRERAAPAPLPPKVAKKPAAPRVQSADEKERLARNEAMRRDKEASGSERARFLEPHRDVLERFGAKLPAAKGKAMAAGSGFREDESIVQPEEVLVPMREYQLRGLRWLVGMHKCGVNAILGA
jgi:SNF2 family DNA or RNA helicase